MSRQTLLVVLAIASAACMEMKETVERMVMVRTTGSDLQPAATGFIYKRNSDGPAKVTKMEEDEVLEHLKKLPEGLYEQPKAFKAPIPVAAGPFYAKEQDENKAASHASAAYVIPVVEAVDEDKEDDKVDGIADEDYSKIFDEYASDFDDYLEDFDDAPGYYGYDDHHHDHDHYNEHGGGSDYGSEEHSAHGGKGHRDYATAHHYAKGGAGSYDKGNREGFSVSGGGGYKKDFDEGDSYGSHYASGHGYKGGDHGHKSAHSKGEETDGYHKVFAKDEFKKDHDFYDTAGLKGGFNKFANGNSFHGSDAGGFKSGGSHDSGHDEAAFGEGGFRDEGSEDEHGVAYSGESGEEAYHHRHGDFGSKGGAGDGKFYGFEVKHR
ncbi:heavy metal-associated isoprenylated plant protein 34-like [Plutella xylostella]|uniref:heavy metal-associated isoprenylated plant protein 34-like n=1 Tax=Plutella xylostella TaxID=51655 RepID=UPI0020322499|nr:heavy metal-associated isoprenylated plant protein 34-like [Plutella xylostella]